MNNENKIKMLHDSLIQIRNLDSQWVAKKREIYANLKDTLDLDPKHDNTIWDYLVHGLEFLRHDIAEALENKTKQTRDK